MGYTHYVQRIKEFDTETWNDFMNDFKKVLPNFLEKNLLSVDPIDSQCLEYNSKKIRFNGIAQKGHETFVFNRVEDDCSDTNSPEDDKLPYFTFCKTNQKDYDLAVTCTLIIAKYHFGDQIRISSDGDIDLWSNAKSLCQHTLGYGDTFRFPTHSMENDIGGYFNECDECCGEGCITCIKPCEAGNHELGDITSFDHATGNGEWAKCNVCDFGVKMYWHTEYIGEKITSPTDMNKILEDFR